ncbi:MULTISPECIES: quinone oxidoreductase family protein [Streptomyces]|uniref:quinone oxidoreductase family protein n=1 Tax=Streptomyces TaxID=1883 RepID=UPI0016757678|nr:MULTISPECIES: zinc-binding dehydrogenase [Streptomyces]MBK3526000.1 zinc-binding dehydrogenase [Streptomyces sp. MBT70]GGR75290.1 oxidoreductase [Streptomyces eurythermus]
MRRVRYESAGGPLFLEEAPVPEPGPGELLVRCAAVGLTLPMVRKVAEAAEPVPLGGEVAGEVVAAGPGVSRFRTGDRVTGLCFGHGYADFAVVREAMASPVPDDAGFVTAIALVRSGLVAYGALEAARFAPGESVLVTAAASGVGHLAVQLARARGAGRVVGAVSGAAKADFVRSLGADDCVRYDDDGWGEPVDCVLDAVGGELLTPALAALAPHGRLVAYSSGGGTIQAYDLLVGAKSVTGFQMALIARERPELYERWRRGLWRLHAEGALRPAVHGEFALEEAEAAHRVITTRANLGKVVLCP